MKLLNFGSGAKGINSPASMHEALHTQGHPQDEGLFFNGETERFRITETLDDRPVKWTIEFPLNLSYKGILFVTNGYSAPKFTSRALRQALVDEGYITCTQDPSRKGTEGWLEDLIDPQKVHAQTHASVQRAIQQHPDIAKMPNAAEVELERSVWLPHSMSILSVMRHLEANPEGAEAMVALMSVIRFPTISGLVKDVYRGTVPGLKHDVIPCFRNRTIELNRKNAVNFLMHEFSNPARTIGEGLSCLRADTRLSMQSLRESGLYIAYLAAQHDVLVAKDPTLNKYVDHLETLPDLGHLGPQKHPEVIARTTTSILHRAQIQ